MSFAQISQDLPFFNRSFFGILFISIFALGMSLILQNVMQIEPCQLCTMQRTCCFLTGALAVAGIVSPVKKNIIVCLLLLSFSNLFIASYHFGIQLGFFSDTCSVVRTETLGEFKRILFQKQHAPPLCSSVSWFLGLPIVVWSIISSCSCLAILTMTLKQTHTS